MVSVQERLKLKRAQIDTWSVREQLCLASSVVRSGDQNWMSVSRSLKAFANVGRPPDWFSQKSCAVQYSNLLENVETPKRKKRTDKGETSVETPSESIVRRLTQERIDELKRLMFEDRQKYAKLKEDVMQIKSGNCDDKLTEMCQDIEEEKKQKEKKAEAHERWLKEREEKKVELERAWKPPVAPASPHRRKHHPKIHRRNSSQSEPSSEAEMDSPLNEPLNVDVIGEEAVQETVVEPEPSQTPTSPLLTSLLKSPSPAPVCQSSSILHSAITSHRGASPTITSLLSSAPGLPGVGNMVTVAPPTTVSSSLKNLVSSAISAEQPHHQPPPHNPSPAAGAPTLSMLLELPPSLPGKPLPELPSAAKTTTLPSSTVSAIVSAASTPSTSRVVAVRTGTGTAVSPASSKISSSLPDSDSNEVHSSQEVKIADSTSREDEMEVLQVDSTQNSDDTHQLTMETKEELIEEVLIEEVVVNDDSVIESELLASEIPDVVVTSEKEVTKNRSDNKEEIKPNEPFIEVSQSTEVLTKKIEIKSEMVADVDSTSSNSELLVNAENTNLTEVKKEECIEAVIDTSSQELVSEIVTDETAAVEVDSATEAELTSGTVAEVIEITDDQEATIQTEVVDECGPCMQELENMEVIILDKVQELDEVHIVEDMKGIGCEVVEVVMESQEKVDDEIKEETEELIKLSPKPEEVTSEKTCSLVADAVIECKNSEDAENINYCKTSVSSTENEEIQDKSENVENEVLNSDIPFVEEEVEGEEEKQESIPDESAENGIEVEDGGEPREIIVEKSCVEEVTEEMNDDNAKDEVQELEQLREDIHQDVIVSTSETPMNSESDEDVNTEELDKNSQCDNICETENKNDLEENMKGQEIQESELQDCSLKDSVEKVNEKESSKNYVSPEVGKEDSTEKSVENEFTSEVVKDIKESSLAKEERLQELSRKDEIIKETLHKIELIESEAKDELDNNTKEDLQGKEQKVSLSSERYDSKAEESVEENSSEEEEEEKGKSSYKDISKIELMKTGENSYKVSKEVNKCVGEKVNVKEREIFKKESDKKETSLPVKELEKDLEVKEAKKEVFPKDSGRKEVQVVLSMDLVKKDTNVEIEVKKPTPSKEFPKRDHLSPRREIQTSRKELLISKKELSATKKDLPVKEGLKENQTKREFLRRDSKEDISKKEVLKRNQTKEEKKELPKDDLKKRSQAKEITKSVKKVDIDVKNTDSKSEPGTKSDRVKRDYESNKEESKDVRRDKIIKESQQRGEDKNKEIFLPKEPKSVSNAKVKSAGEENSKVSLEKKDGKENLKTNDKNEVISKQAPVENVEEKHEKRSLMRAETPSTEDDKTNDAEPPKIVGRKRLAAVNVMDSVPNSPASTTDEEREYKSWKKSIMLLYGRLATHKYASLFLRPITDDQAPGYSSVVHRPIDLLTIKKNIETGVIRTTSEFQRDVMLMFLNSIMYNKSSHLVHKMAKQMQQEGMQHIQDYLTTQMLVQVVGDGVPIRRETRTTEANKQRDLLGNPSNMTNMDENEGTQMPKRKRNAASDSSDRGFKKKKVDE